MTAWALRRAIHSATGPPARVMNGHQHERMIPFAASAVTNFNGTSTGYHNGAISPKLAIGKIHKRSWKRPLILTARPADFCQYW